jgi:ATP-dependent DNA helicase PIF1
VSKGDDPKKYCFEARTWKKTMTTCVELHQVHRQNDPEFVDVLARIRCGRCTPADVALLRATERNDLGGDDGVEATRLCTHVKDAEGINARKLKELPGAAHKFDARDEYA